MSLAKFPKQSSSCLKANPSEAAKTYFCYDIWMKSQRSPWSYSVNVNIPWGNQCGDIKKTKRNTSWSPKRKTQTIIILKNTVSYFGPRKFKNIIFLFPKLAL